MREYKQQFKRLWVKINKTHQYPELMRKKIPDKKLDDWPRFE